MTRRKVVYELNIGRIYQSLPLNKQNIPSSDPAEKGNNLPSYPQQDAKIRGVRATKLKTITPTLFPTTIYHTASAITPPTTVPKHLIKSPFKLAPVVGLIPKITVIVIQTPRYSTKKL